MDTPAAVAAVAVPATALLVVSAPVLALWLGLAVLPRAGRDTRTDLIGGLGCGLLAAGAASLLGLGFDRLAGVSEPDRLTGYVPLVEEPLKAAAIVLALGGAAAVRGGGLPLRRCALATGAVVAAFAAGENAGHLGALFFVDGVRFGDAAAVWEALRVRAVLPPLGHLAETWPAGAAVWLAGRCRGARRAAVLAAGLAAAVAVHALWNWSALRWWPEPWPLLAIVAISAVAAATTIRCADRGLVATRMRRYARYIRGHHSKIGAR